MREDLRVHWGSETRWLRVIRALVRGYLETTDLTVDKADAVVLAVDEACANAVRHAYRGRTDGPLSLSIASDPASGIVQFTLEDEGVPAPRARVQRKARAPSALAPPKPGGLGVPILYTVFDEVEFYPGEERGNRVVLRLKRSGYSV